MQGEGSMLRKQACGCTTYIVVELFCRFLCSQVIENKNEDDPFSSLADYVLARLAS